MNERATAPVKGWLARVGVVVGGAAAATVLTVTAAAAAGPPLPDFRGRGLIHVFNTVDARTPVHVQDIGGRRHVLWPFNWKVCTQSPAPGKQVAGGPVSIGVVKNDERCPAR
ncbi:hypothetical protein [Streptomyces sp. NPDC047123]|uniref:hypothetical protein n=1 Tax=Streptomyces sp. NPDC047123 TaxID=3155622 RepID=UPI0033F295DB